MPWTLYGYILRELLKLLVPITLVLIGLLSFVASIKPMSEGLLGASSLAKFLGYTSPTMLALALPFAGALASTLVFLRMASDNEVVACAASGMSYRTVLMPAALLGLVLTMSLFMLSNFVLPRFYRAATQTVQADMVTALVAQLNRNRPFDRFEDVVVYADSAEQIPPSRVEPPTPLPSKLIELNRVAVLQFDDNGDVRRDVTARTAHVLVYQGTGGQMWVRLQCKQDAMVYDTERRALGRVWDQPENPDDRPGDVVWNTRLLRMPSPFHNSPEFFTWFELRALANHPDSFEPIRQLRGKLTEALGTATLRQRLDSRLSGSGRVDELTLHGPRAGERYTFSAPATSVSDGVNYLEATEQQPAEVRSVRYVPTGQRIEAGRVAFEVGASRIGAEPIVRGLMEGARIYVGGAADNVRQKAEHELPPLLRQPLTLHGPREGERYTFTAPSNQMSDNVIELISTDQAPAVVRYESPGQPGWRVEAGRIELRIARAQPDAAPTVTPILNEMRVYDPRSPGRFVEYAERQLPQLMFPASPAAASERVRAMLRGEVNPDEEIEGLSLYHWPEGDRYIFSAPAGGTSDGQFYLEGSDTEPAVMQVQERRERHYEEQRRIAMEVNLPRAGTEPTLSVTLFRGRVYDPLLRGSGFTEYGDEAGDDDARTLPVLHWPEPLTEPFQNDEAMNLLATAESARYAQSPDVRQAARELRNRLVELSRQITSQLHQRGALAIACLLLLLLGGVLSIHMRHQMPLVVFLWCFLLAIVNLILIYVGENMAGGTEFPRLVGLSLVWVGNVTIMVVIAWVYSRLARN